MTPGSMPLDRKWADLGSIPDVRTVYERALWSFTATSSNAVPACSPGADCRAAGGPGPEAGDLMLSSAQITADGANRSGPLGLRARQPAKTLAASLVLGAVLIVSVPSFLRMGPWVDVTLYYVAARVLLSGGAPLSGRVRYQPSRNGLDSRGDSFGLRLGRRVAAVG